MTGLNHEEVSRALEVIDGSIGEEAHVLAGDLSIEVCKESVEHGPARHGEAMRGNDNAGLSGAEIAEIIEVARETDFLEVRIEVGDWRLVLSRRESGEPDRLSGVPQVRAQEPSSAESASEVASADPSAVTIPAPVLGTFYRGPSPEEPPFVEVGTAVEEDTVVCIIEVMKLMNQITADVRGMVDEVFVEDGSLVEYGQPLFSVRPA